jgi:hypothetical protein
MKPITSYIETLILTHECVIIPDFGGFVTHHQSAQYRELQHKFLPPTKTLHFNTKLLINDGLLANTISLHEQISYQEALNSIQIWVKEIKQELKEKDNILLIGIGTLKQKENQLIFEPDNSKNFSLQSFGLDSLTLSPIKQPSNEESNISLLAEETEAKVISINTKKSTHWKKIAVAAITIPFLAYILWIPSKTEIFKGNNFTYADLNPFSTKICPNFKIRTQSIIEIKEPIPNTPLSIFENDLETIEISIFQPNDKEYQEDKKIIVKLKDNLNAIAESTAFKIDKKKTYRFHIIGGCFQDYNNAEKLTEKLQNLGFESFIIDQNKGLYRVSFQSYNSRKEALKALAFIKKEHVNNAWLLVK